MKTTTSFFKSVAIVAIALMFGFSVNAQENNKVKTNQLSVTVAESYSLKLSNENAIILLDSEDKFANGSQSSPITMTIFSSKKYAISAQVSSAQFSGTAENTSVNTNNVDLIVTKVSGNDEAMATERTNQSLKHAQAEEIASSSKSTKADVYNLTYAIPAVNTSAFLDQYGKTITTEITYTLLPL